MDLIAALASLDSENDDHWTANGLPLVDVLKEMTGADDLTRSVIDAAAPDYTRTNRFDLTGEDEEPDVEAPAAAPEPQVISTPVDANKEAIDQAERECDELIVQINELQAQLVSRQGALELARTVEAASRPKISQADAVKAYQQRGLEQRLAAAEKQSEAAALLGLDQGPSRVGQSKLDQVMARRRGSGRQRRRTPQTLAGKD